MKNKQIVGIVVAGLVFVFVCSMSILTNNLSKKMFPQNNLLDTLKESSLSFNLPMEDFIGVVNVEGTIMSTSTSPLFATATYNHQRTLDLIDALMKSENNKGILLNVDSPGGGVYESDELYLKLKEYKEVTKRPIWTYMKSQACSGGYYIAMASDKVIANRNTWTGSIGVIIGLSNYKELLDKIGVKSIYITSGDNKAMGAAGIDMTKEQEQILQSLVDESYEQFVGIVAEGRSMSVGEVKPIADGRIYSALQALDLNLIDEVDTYEDTEDKFMKEIGGYVTMYTPNMEDPLSFNSLLGMFQEVKPVSDVQVMAEFLESEGSGVPMYYAKPEQY